MSRFFYINGQFLPAQQAVVSVEDRAYVFGDGVYEVIHFKGRCLIDGEKHLERLVASAQAVRISLPPLTALRLIIKKLLMMNRSEEGALYLQVSRGIAPRDQLFPSPQPRPSVFLFVKEGKFAPLHSISVVTGQDVRWKGCHIKSLNLLPNVLARQNASDQQAYETWFVNEQDYITEGSLSNAWIVKKGTLYTAPSTANILNGITRQRVIALAKQLKMSVKEQFYSLTEALKADEAFVTSTNSPIIAVGNINGQSIGSGQAGPIVSQLYKAYMDFVKGECKNDR